MSLPSEEPGEGRRGRPRKKPLAGALDTAVGEWARYAREAVDGTWPLRLGAEVALRSERVRLSRLLSGEGLSDTGAVVVAEVGVAVPACGGVCEVLTGGAAVMVFRYAMS
ncbi:hypothetical protein [Streptomyces sp. GS7]|uniref:hypothetical protein n=1 Tax=Streptomyces sp. GS7 TaxID=2692234 RepID=UPI0013188FC0|nr:hypothetical protein [Streptomyces sp. GS7]QHC23344.1 hypothetical protein GR130_20040 [Streptomyces sp. GS7]